MRGSVGPLLDDEVRSGASRHVAVPEPSWMGRWGPEHLGTWQCRSPPRRRGGGPEPWTCGSVGALHKLRGEFWYRGGTWQHVDAYLAFCLGLKYVRLGTWSAGYRQWRMGSPRERL
jgi:hypothetical protein